MRSLAALAVPLLALACTRGTASPPPVAERIDDALARALDYLVAAQSADGAWRSLTYGALKDDWTLSATCTKALAFGPGGAESARALERGLEWLASALGAEGEISAGAGGLPYPVYTASLAVIAFARAEPQGGARWNTARDAWLRVLESHQLVESLGWSEDDPAYGGWSYASRPPRRAAGGAFEADLSSTVFALGALRLAGRGADAPSVRRALTFVQRCQNLPLEGELADPARDDGGFFMSPSVELQNKAGGGWHSSAGRQRFASYGSMTADGLRALLRCGLAPEHPRVRAARAWLEAHFNAGSNPGSFEPLREVERDAAWHYWGWSLAHARIELADGGPGAWAAELAEELLARQRDDGSWSNPFTMMKEDDPLVATPLALSALSLCRVSLLVAGE